MCYSGVQQQAQIKPRTANRPSTHKQIFETKNLKQPNSCCCDKSTCCDCAVFVTYGPFIVYVRDSVSLKTLAGAHWSCVACSSSVSWRRREASSSNFFRMETTRLQNCASIQQYGFDLLVSIIGLRPSRFAG